MDYLKDRHLLLFGKIVQWFARYELLMQQVMATVTGSDSASVMLLTRGLDFSGKRRALFDLLRHRTDRIDAPLSRQVPTPAHSANPLVSTGRGQDRKTRAANIYALTKATRQCRARPVAFTVL